MSTTINVTVDDGGLPARNKQQTAANRQAFVQGQASQQAAQQGADQRAADRRAAGLDPATGRPLASAGASSRLPRIQQEPAANRQKGLALLLVPSQGYFSYGGTLSGLPSISRGISPPIFSRYFHEDSTIYPFGRNYPEMLFRPVGGPASSGALQLDPQYVMPGEDLRPFIPISGSVPGEQSFYFTVESTPEVSGLAYSVVNSPYDTVLGRTANVFEPGLPPFKLLNLQGAETLPSSSKRISDLKEFTLEFLFQVGNGLLQPGYVRRTLSATEPSRTVQCLIEFFGLAIRLTATESYSFGPTYTVLDTVANQSRIIRDFTAQSTYRIGLVVAGKKLSRVANPDVELVINPSSNDFPYLQGVTDGSWVHVAVVKRPTPEGSRWSVFFNGSTVISDITERADWATTYGNQPLYGFLSIRSFRATTAKTELFLPSIHGYRLTSKALYLENFSPPVSITSFA
jgi:hypothetical protein